MHQTVALRKRFFEVRHTFVCTVLHGRLRVTDTQVIRRAHPSFSNKIAVAIERIVRRSGHRLSFSVARVERRLAGAARES